MKHVTVAVWVALALAGVAQARDLVQVYDDAVQFDPTIAGANATRLAQRENFPQALSALLPQVSGNYIVSRTKSDGSEAESYPDPLTGQSVILPISSNGYTDE